MFVPGMSFQNIESAWKRLLVSREFISSDLYSEGVGFNNNTSASFDTILEIRLPGSESCITYLITVRNLLLVFYNNTNASFDTILGIRMMGSETCITHFVYYSGTEHWYSITTLVQILIPHLTVYSSLETSSHDTKLRI